MTIKLIVLQVRFIIERYREKYEQFSDSLFEKSLTLIQLKVLYCPLVEHITILQQINEYKSALSVRPTQ